MKISDKIEEIQKKQMKFLGGKYKIKGSLHIMRSIDKCL